MLSLLPPSAPLPFKLKFLFESQCIPIVSISALVCIVVLFSCRYICNMVTDKTRYGICPGFLI